MENPSFIFSSGPVELKEEGENFFVEGYISTSDLDLVNDIVTKNCLMDMAEQMRSRTIKLDIEHESFKGATNLEMQINKTIIPAAKIEDFLMDKKGLKVRAMLNRHIQRFQEVKNSIRDGFLDAFSIAFVPVKSEIAIKDGQEVRMLEKVNLLNVAFTGNPINTNASIEKVFMKSLEFLKDQEKAKPKRPKPQPDPHKEPEDEDEEKTKGSEGHKPDKTGPHGRGAGPGQGRADGSGMDKDEKKKKKKEEEDEKKGGPGSGRKPTGRLSGLSKETRETRLRKIYAADILYGARKISKEKYHKIVQDINAGKYDKKSLFENYDHLKNDTIKLQEVKKMEEDNKEEETTEAQEEGQEEGEAESTESESTETKDEESSEEPGEKEDEEKGEPENTEVKSLKSKVNSLEKEMAEIKAKIKMPVRKSKVEQQDKSENFVEEKSKNPLDLIA